MDRKYTKRGKETQLNRNEKEKTFTLGHGPCRVMVLVFLLRLGLPLHRQTLVCR